jgi:tetratricopeptide (TPR) repeat protein
MAGRIEILSMCMALLAVAVLGCASTPGKTRADRPEHGKSPAQEAEKPDPAAADRPQQFPEPAANSYYFYIESHLHRKQGRLDSAIEFMKAAIERDPGVLQLNKELALLYLRKDDHHNALDIVDRLLAEKPEDVELLLMKASMERSLDPESDVTEIYEEALSIDPERKEIYKVLGKTYLDAGKLEAAARVFSRMVEHFPDAYVGHFYLGRVYARLGRQEAARRAFEKTIELAPALNQPRWELINLYEKQNRAGKVISLYEEILAQTPENVAAALELSLAYFEQDRSREAEKLLRKLGRRAAGDASVIRTVMQRMVLEERYSDALRLLRPMLQAAPRDSALQYALGVVHYHLDEYKAARRSFEAVPSDSDFYVNAAIHRGIMAYQEEDPERAVEILEEAVGSVKDPGKLELIPYLSSFYQETGHLQTAEEWLRRGLEIDSRSTELHFELGVLLDEKGNSEAAIEQMRQVLAIDPEHADALNYIGYTYADQGIRLDEAESLVRKALDQDPENGYILDSMGWVYYKKEMFEKALAYLEKAARLVPDDPIILEHLGDVYVKVGRPGKALDAYKRALELKSGDEGGGIRAKIDDLRKNGS